MEASTLVRLIFAALSLIAAVYVGMVLWQAAFGGAGFDLDQLAQRIEYVSCSDGGSMAQKNCFSDKAFTTLFSMQAERNDVLVVFEEPGGTITFSQTTVTQIDRGGWGESEERTHDTSRTLTNPYETAPSICRVSATNTGVSQPRRRDCAALPTSADAIMVYSALNGATPSAQTRSNRYIQFGGFSIEPETDNRYPELSDMDVFPPIIYFPEDNIYPLYLEYAPPHEDFEWPRLLITLYDAEDPHFAQRRNALRYGSGNDLAQIAQRINEMGERITLGQSSYERGVHNVYADRKRVILFFGEADPFIRHFYGAPRTRNNVADIDPDSQSSQLLVIQSPCQGSCICSQSLYNISQSPPVLSAEDCVEIDANIVVSTVHRPVYVDTDQSIRGEPEGFWQSLAQLITGPGPYYKAFGGVSSEAQRGLYYELPAGHPDRRVYPPVIIFPQEGLFDAFIEVLPPSPQDPASRLRVLFVPLLSSPDTYSYLDARRETIISD